jgi:hypothetical protein
MKIINSTPNPLFLAYIILLFGLFTRVFKFLQNVSILAGSGADGASLIRRQNVQRNNTGKKINLNFFL